MTRVRILLPLLGCVLLGCTLLALFAPGGLLRRDEPPPTPPQRSAYSPDAYIDLAQAHLRRYPGDRRTWADLGSAYLDLARRTGDSALYDKAQGAFQRSLPHIDGLIGMGALANARHDFFAGLRWGSRARQAAPYRWSLYAVLTDAYVELGQYAAAGRTLRHMLAGRPDLVSFTRAGHLFSLRGDVPRAREALERARAIASEPADYAFCSWSLGELAWSSGDPRGALTAYDQALAADPSHRPSLAGRARALAALGQGAAALRDYAAAGAAYVVEYGELREHLGDRVGARQSYALFLAQVKLQAAHGVTDSLAVGRFEADHGSPAVAVRQLRAEWGRRKSVDVADALGWALHQAGDHASAARYAAYADRLGGRNALFAYHRGEIYLALGRRGTASAQLKRALSINPYFSFDGAAKARAALGGSAARQAALGGSAVRRAALGGSAVRQAALGGDV
jgi:tetratricopeptide (TPR) repeat protein